MVLIAPGSLCRALEPQPTEPEIGQESTPARDLDHDPSTSWRQNHPPVFDTHPANLPSPGFQQLFKLASSTPHVPQREETRTTTTTTTTPSCSPDLVQPESVLNLPSTASSYVGKPIRRIRRFLRARRARIFSYPRSSCQARSSAAQDDPVQPSPPPIIPSATALPILPSPPPPPAAGSPPPPASSPPVAEDLQFAFEALYNLATFCPDWARRLDELCGQIAQRQVDLAQFAAAQRRSVRCSGSTESLKPKDDGEAYPSAAEPEIDGMGTVNGRKSQKQTPNHQPSSKNNTKNVRASTTAVGDPARATAGKEVVASSVEGNSSPTPSSVERQTPEVAATASANARANLKKPAVKSNKRGAKSNESILTDGGAAVVKRYRSRSLVIVYYDSYVQSFFEEVVKFVSASRNLMRKAKMAAKVAQIRRMAEMVPEDHDDDDECMDGIGSRGFGIGSAQLEPPQLSPSLLQPQVDGTKTEVKPKAETNPGAVHAGPDYRNGGSTGFPISTADQTRLPDCRPNGRNYIASSPRAFRTSMAIASSYRSNINNMGQANGADQPLDIFETLDKSLELAQSLCEIAAHQFLRDGDCADEISRIKESLTKAQTSADTELRRRLADDDADGSLAKLWAEGPPPASTYCTRTARMRPNLTQGVSVGVDGNDPNGKSAPPLTVDGPDFSGPMTLEVDWSVVGPEKGNPQLKTNGDPTTIPPILQYQSTPAMGPPPRVSAGL